ncbi:HEAT repeat domain-containing protein [Hymenobacter sp. BT683]|uniref:HEAT repeat domain-containing protein n=1 Tax=Hymenobacter jeongseonensis TaxID=2791027 RepID=A0ABS0IFL7_9BACT|nr:HEAT repeat domain-containing protein [Hymenobacter jeongseonensis]MBF9236967.1 HEAT repeat domain-containing protein [Hymenobacter jeongseonensis]
MNCERTKEQLVDYLGSQLSASEQAELTAHLAECADCREELQAVESMWQTLGKVRVPEPSAHIRPDFYAMLATFKESVDTTPDYTLKGLWQWWLNLDIPRPILRAVYSLCLLGVGLIGGYWFSNSRTTGAADQQQIAQLATQVGNMRQMMMLALIENPSASERLRAVSYTKQLDEPTTKVVDALLSTLDNDPNVNVRLATLEALAPLAQDPAVRQGLVHSLARQESPLVQTALADVMVQLQERRSVKPLRELLKQENLDESVKSKIEQTIQTLSTGRPAAPSTPPRNDQTNLTSPAQRAAVATV